MHYLKQINKSIAKYGRFNKKQYKHLKIMSNVTIEYFIKDKLIESKTSLHSSCNRIIEIRNWLAKNNLHQIRYNFKK